MNESVIIQTIQDALNTSADRARDVYSQWQKHMRNVEEDMEYLSNVAQEELHNYSKLKITHEGADNIAWAEEQKRGVVFLSAHYACFYWMLFAKLGFREIIITRLDHDERSRRIINNIESIVPMKLPNVLANAGAVPRIYKSLKKGEAAYAMFDFYTQNGPFVVSEFMGKEVASPFALLSLAYRNKSIIVPIFCFASADQRCIISETPIDPKQYRGEEHEFVYDTTIKMHELITRYIHDFPEQWQLWDNLGIRWEFATKLAG